MKRAGSEQDVEQLAEAGDFLQAGVGELLTLLQFPDHVVGDVDGVGASLKGGGDVGTERVAYHERLFRGYAEVLAELAVRLLGLVGDGLHVREIGLQSRAVQLVLLVEQLALGEDDEAVAARLRQLAQGGFDLRQRRGGEEQQLASQGEQLHDDVAGELLAADAYGILDERQGEGLGAIACQGQVTALGGKESLADLVGGSPRREQLAALVFYLVEPRLAVPQRVVGIEGHNFYINH